MISASTKIVRPLQKTGKKHYFSLKQDETIIALIYFDLLTIKYIIIKQLLHLWIFMNICDFCSAIKLIHIKCKISYREFYAVGSLHMYYTTGHILPIDEDYCS